MASSKKMVPRPGYKIVFVAYITLKDGRIIWARNYGKRAFPMEVPV